jgi:uncharacterized protein YcgI (DUF1989 family)
VTIGSNRGHALTVSKGQLVRVEGTTIADFVAFNLKDLSERLDQARTKATNSKIFVTAGDYLVAQTDQPMFQIVNDGFPDGTHDLDKGMCSASGYQYRLKARGGKLEKQEERVVQAVPSHGCWENLIEALKPWNIAAEDIPNPFNIFMAMKVDAETGAFSITSNRPKHVACVDLVAEIDCLIGISACPDTIVGGKSIDVTIFDQ